MTRRNNSKKSHHGCISGLLWEDWEISKNYFQVLEIIYLDQLTTGTSLFECLDVH